MDKINYFMRYLFILGRNPGLSIAEIKSYLVREGNKILSERLIETGYLVELESELVGDVVDRLGGTIAIGMVLETLNNLNKINLYSGTSNKFNYVIWDFSDKTEEVSDYLKKRFRSEKLKSTEKKLKDSLELQTGEKVQMISSKKVDEEYFVFDGFFGRIFQKSDYASIEKRDMEKPIRRESLSISPRLAKIMINLSQVKSGYRLLDAFCGIGVIMEEALLQHIKVVGIDRDYRASEGAKQNLEWFGFDKGNYEIICEDSSQVEIETVQGMVSEPDFGEILKKIPTKEKAGIMIKKFEDLMINVLNNLKRFVDGRIVFTAPFIRIGKERISCNFNRITSKTGLKMLELPIPEFRGGQVVGRHIVVFGK